MHTRRETEHLYSPDTHFKHTFLQHDTVTVKFRLLLWRCNTITNINLSNVYKCFTTNTHVITKKVALCRHKVTKRNLWSRHCMTISMNETAQLEYVGFDLPRCRKINRVARTDSKAGYFLNRLDQQSSLCRAHPTTIEIHLSINLVLYF